MPCSTPRSIATLFAALLSLCAPGAAQAADMPKELQGRFASGSAEACPDIEDHYRETGMWYGALISAEGAQLLGVSCKTLNVIGAKGRYQVKEKCGDEVGEANDIAVYEISEGKLTIRNGESVESYFRCADPKPDAH